MVLSLHTIHGGHCCEYICVVTTFSCCHDNRPNIHLIHTPLSQVDGIIGCGSALQKNPLLQDEVQKVFSLPLVMTSSAADMGAALTCLNLF